MSHILVAVSTPWAGQHMTKPLGQLARRLEARVTLLHINRAIGGDSARGLEEGRQAVNRLCEQLAAEGVPCESRLLEATDDIPGAILQAAGEVGATLIFMGITGKSPFARSAGGDIPAELLRRTTLPVLLLPPALDVEL